MLTFRYRLYPSKEQQVILWKHANKLNWLYNYFLNQRIEEYKIGNKIFKKQQQAELISLKEQHSELKEIHSQVVQQIPLRLDKSYKNFFRRVKNKSEAPGFPKFRSCKKFFGICYPQSGFSINGNVFKTKIYGEIPFIKHCDIRGNILQVYIKCNIHNHWYISITTDYNKLNNEKPISSVGIDLGLKNIVVTSDNNKIKNCTHAKYFDKQIGKLNSIKDTNCKKKSRKFRYLQKVIHRLYDAKSRKINDFQHKASKCLSRKYNTIYAEDLSVKRMSESKATGLNKALRNAKLAQFLIFLEYKVNSLVKVNPRNTSKTCNNCGHIHKDLKLTERTIKCTSCGIEYDRDENAAKNVYCLGQAIDSGLCTEEHDIGYLFNPWYSGSFCL